MFAIFTNISPFGEMTEIDLTIAQLLKWVDQPPSICIRIQKIMLGKVMLFNVTKIF